MKDVLLDKNGDLAIENGDFVLADSDNQHQKLILKSNKGEWKERPEVGVGIVQMLNDELFDEMLVEAKKQLEYDGMIVRNIRFEQDGRLIIDGKYGDNGQG